MKTLARTAWAWALLLLAIGSWALVVWSVQTIDVMAAEQQSVLDASIDQQAKDTTSARLRSLIADTAEQRARLAEYTHLDIVDAAKRIEAAGNPVKVDLHVRDAGLEAQQGATRNRSVQTFRFSVEGDGTFTQLMNTATLLQSLPFPVQIVQFELTGEPIDPDKPTPKNPQWHATFRLRIFTTAPIPS